MWTFFIFFLINFDAFFILTIVQMRASQKNRKISFYMVSLKLVFDIHVQLSGTLMISNQFKTEQTRLTLRNVTLRKEMQSIIRTMLICRVRCAQRCSTRYKMHDNTIWRFIDCGMDIWGVVKLKWKVWLKSKSISNGIAIQTYSGDFKQKLQPFIDISNEFNLFNSKKGARFATPHFNVVVFWGTIK